jgi:MYXO-CTERM domain-containing protein
VLGAAVLLYSACGSTSGCAGCAPNPIDFEKEHPAQRFDNAMQVRLSQQGISFLETNFESMVTMLVPGGLNFTIPPTDCSSNSQKICCSGPACSVQMSISSVNLTPTPQSTLALDLRAQVKTPNKIKFEKNLWIYWLECDVNFDSTKASPSTIGLKANIDLVVQPADGNRLAIKRGATTLEDFSCSDITISGGIDCTIAGWLCTFFKGTIEKQMIGTLDSTVDGMLKSLPLGQQGRFDVASFLQSYSPRTTGLVDYYLWAGGYAEAEQSGMSLGIQGGFRAAKPNACVPSCEGAGAKCTPPAKAAIPRSNAFRVNTRPDGKPFDVGIGVDTKSLDLGAYAMYSSGGLCLDISTQTLPALSSDMFAILVPSLKSLTSGSSVPMMLSVRPRNPPTVALGAGKWHKDTTGKVVIDDPLLKLKAKDFAADIYVQLDERMVRLFTVVGDLELPALLYADANGNLQPMLGSLDTALTNIRLENADLITEDTATLAKLFPTILSLAASFLASGFDPIELPSVQSLKLVLDNGSITTVDANKVLAIFANLGLVKPKKFVDEGRLEVDASVEALVVPETSAFRVSRSFDPFAGPKAWLRVGARGAVAGEPLEYAFRIDGGFFRPWEEGDRLLVQDPIFWLQGEHTVEVIARVKGRPETTSRVPARLTLPIRSRATSSALETATPPAAPVEAAPETGGCALVPGAGPGAPALLLLLGLILLARRRRRR